MSTAGSELEAATLARALVEAQLAACVQLIPMTSWYRWKGDVTNDSEILLLIKTRRSHYAKVQALIEELHSYETPEVVAIPIVGALPEYLRWLDEATGGRVP